MDYNGSYHHLVNAIWLFYSQVNNVLGSRERVVSGIRQVARTNKRNFDSTGALCKSEGVFDFCV
jgi:hypothetical protein